MWHRGRKNGTHKGNKEPKENKQLPVIAHVLLFTLIHLNKKRAILEDMIHGDLSIDDEQGAYEKLTERVVFVFYRNHIPLEHIIIKKSEEPRSVE